MSRKKEKRQKRGERKKKKQNSKTLILKDSSVRSIWTYLTASPCCTTNTNKHDYTVNRYYKHDKQLINAVSQSSYKCAEKSELYIFHGHTSLHIYNPTFLLGKHVIQTNPSKFDEMLFSDIYLCRLRLKQGREIQDFMF